MKDLQTLLDPSLRPESSLQQVNYMPLLNKREFISNQVLLCEPEKSNKSKIKKILFQLYRQLQSNEYVTYVDLYNKSNSINLHRQLQCNEYLLLPNQVILLNLNGMTPPHKCTFDLSNKVDCIKLYMTLECTEQVTFVNDNLQNLFKNLHIVISRFKEIFTQKEFFKYNGNRKQYAWAVLETRDGLFFFFKPEFPCQQNNPVRIKHSEDFLIDHIMEELDKNTEKIYTKLFIYSVNTPCIGRKCQEPCMVKLTNLSRHLSEEYNIETYIGFSQFYASGDLHKYLPLISFCNYNTSKHIKDLVNEIQPSKKCIFQHNEIDTIELQKKFLNEHRSTYFHLNIDSNIVLKSLQKTTDYICYTTETPMDKEAKRRIKKYIAKLKPKVKEISPLKKAKLCELKEMGEVISYDFFGENNHIVSQDHHFIISECWAYHLDKLINDSVSGHIQKILVQFWIESNKYIKHNPTVVYVDI